MKTGTLVIVLRDCCFPSPAVGRVGVVQEIRVDSRADGFHAYCEQCARTWPIGTVFYRVSGAKYFLREWLRPITPPTDEVERLHVEQLREELAKTIARHA